MHACFLISGRRTRSHWYGFGRTHFRSQNNSNAILLSELSVPGCVHLQPLTGEVMSGLSENTQDGAGLDIAMEGFWDGVS